MITVILTICRTPLTLTEKSRDISNLEENNIVQERLWWLKRETNQDTMMKLLQKTTIEDTANTIEFNRYNTNIELI